MLIQTPSALDEELYQSILSLLAQLKEPPPHPTQAHLELVINSETTTLLIARQSEDSPIVGMLTLVIYRVPSGHLAHIEDLVVRMDMRNQGIATALIQSAIQLAAKSGASSLTLTSNPRRLVANHLYLTLGFKQWHTNSYFFELPS